ncbi:hypothetical protein [Neorhizobium sp. S3-V5DH]|uniref:hypothetical protein n=1 Tax=Neorhizobium sp. S3-V5DH TaxID=2485166 RepID=UPI00104DF288|nr:hypothetical protein [Neorhizobium sp. S3-V5DH]
MIYRLAVTQEAKAIDLDLDQVALLIKNGGAAADNVNSLGVERWERRFQLVLRSQCGLVKDTVQNTNERLRKPGFPIMAAR